MTTLACLDKQHGNFFFQFFFIVDMCSLHSGEQWIFFSAFRDTGRQVDRRPCPHFLICVSPILSIQLLISRSYTQVVGLRHVFFIRTRKLLTSRFLPLSIRYIQRQRTEYFISFGLPHDLRRFYLCDHTTTEKQKTGSGQPSNDGLCFWVQPCLLLMRSQKKTQEKERRLEQRRSSMSMEMYFKKTCSRQTSPNEGWWPSCLLMPLLSILIFHPHPSSFAACNSTHKSG